MVLKRAAALIRDRADELARLAAVEMGKLPAQSAGEVALSAAILDCYADHAQAFLAPEKLTSPGTESMVESCPVGVLLGVEPWNYPYYQVARFAAPNLMAGNVVMVKHAVAGHMDNSGQACTASKRFIVVESLADRFLEKFAPALGNFSAGDPSIITAPMWISLQKPLQLFMCQLFGDEEILLAYGRKSKPEPFARPKQGRHTQDRKDRCGNAVNQPYRHPVRNPVTQENGWNILSRKKAPFPGHTRSCGERSINSGHRTASDPWASP